MISVNDSGFGRSGIMSSSQRLLSFLALLNILIMLNSSPESLHFCSTSFMFIGRSKDIRTFKAVEMEMDFVKDMMQTISRYQENPLELKRQTLRRRENIRTDCAKERAELEKASSEQEAINGIVERILRLPVKD